MKGVGKAITFIIFLLLIILLGSFSRLVTKELFGPGLAPLLSDMAFLFAFIYLLKKMGIFKKFAKNQVERVAPSEKFELKNVTPRGWFAIIVAVVVFLLVLVVI